MGSHPSNQLKLSRSSSRLLNWLSQIRYRKNSVDKSQCTRETTGSSAPITSERKESQNFMDIMNDPPASRRDSKDKYMMGGFWNKKNTTTPQRSFSDPGPSQPDINQRSERWAIKHELITLAMDGLFSSPDKVTQLSCLTEKQILQIGCGSSAWGIDLATRYPRWVVIGLDNLSSELFPQHTPENFKYIECTNILQQLKKIPSKTFDLISCRFLIFSITFEDYRQVMHECLRILKPDCHLEFMELDLRIYYQNPMSYPLVTSELNHRIMKHMELNSLDPRLARRLQDLVDNKAKTMESKYVSLPLGVWGGRLGVMFRDDLHAPL
ncbi:unnamed protein product [Rhizopus stolonifer]